MWENSGRRGIEVEDVACVEKNEAELPDEPNLTFDKLRHFANDNIRLSLWLAFQVSVTGCAVGGISDSTNIRCLFSLMCKGVYAIVTSQSSKAAWASVLSEKNDTLQRDIDFEVERDVFLRHDTVFQFSYPLGGRVTSAAVCSKAATYGA